MVLCSSVVVADIYKYVDKDGVIHFTDVPTDRRFKIYMRDLKRDKELRRKFDLTACSRDPKQFEASIDKYSRMYNVDKALIKAVIHAESNYNPHAVSRAGAKGLMQLMPETAKQLKVCDSFDADENIRGGVRYLRFLLDTFNGDVELALAAYNAGMSRVAKYGGVPPYKETETYIAKVLSYQEEYEKQ
jgi:soluble lytic murein transglycosylase-like protein